MQGIEGEADGDDSCNWSRSRFLRSNCRFCLLSSRARLSMLSGAGVQSGILVVVGGGGGGGDTAVADSGGDGHWLRNWLCPHCWSTEAAGTSPGDSSLLLRRTGGLACMPKV